MKIGQVFPSVHFSPERLHQLLGLSLHQAAVAGIPNPYHKFVAPHSPEDVGLAKYPAQGSGQQTQGVVAGGMAQAVVNHLEAVQIHEQKHAAAAGAQGVFHSAPALLPVIQTCERVHRRLFPQSQGFAVLLVDIGEAADEQFPSTLGTRKRNAAPAVIGAALSADMGLQQGGPLGRPPGKLELHFLQLGLGLGMNQGLPELSRRHSRAPRYVPSAPPQRINLPFFQIIFKHQMCHVGQGEAVALLTQ
ncbi:hypothetical protein SDC9_80589 [bioreactor metagenome]|uniref:Uncharacterized protein n=1 Tax=bioreactor metagenome TaxID=1076179 RepID=A0A644Z135_9ZZZZ